MFTDEPMSLQAYNNIPAFISIASTSSPIKLKASHKSIHNGCHLHPTPTQFLVFQMPNCKEKIITSNNKLFLLNSKFHALMGRFQL